MTDPTTTLRTIVVPDTFVATEGAFERHLTDRHHTAPHEGCPHCACLPLLADLHRVWTDGTDDDVERLYAMQDGYGIVGHVPSQGLDWSGVRDSSPPTVFRMWVACTPQGRRAYAQREGF